MGQGCPACDVSLRVGLSRLLLARRRRIRIVIETVAYSEGDTLAFGEYEVRRRQALETP